ncbi:G-type lectin S-receptor-like serine/threonine-protein kinase LECRK3 [Hevea brasiliensis]|nr:G-type lectin S-receptor-like serine/threonine-protein kinase LECRK3 [Hevea brasiliensis]
MFHNPKIVAMVLFLLILSSIFSGATAQQRTSNISLGSSLTPNSSYWSSDSGHFAFGFYPKGDGFAVGIWFAKIQQKTVIWTANRDDPPLPNDVTLSWSSDGRLILQLNQGQQIPIAEGSQPAFSASMLDSGNFVLYDSESRIIWQSFDVPTDSILPGQRLLAGKKLVSSISNTNKSSGRFQLIMQTDGNLVQYPVEYAEKDYAYWHSDTYTAGENVSLNLDSNGHLYLLNATGFNIKILKDGGTISGNLIYRATVDVDGIFRLYSHNLDQYGNWSIEWWSSDNKCDPIGLCGVNAYCTLVDQGTSCACPPGFDFIDQGQKNLGCQRNSSNEDCKRFRKSNYIIQELEAVSWEDNPYAKFQASTETECREECLTDCNCEAALYKNQECRKQRLPLRFGRIQRHEPMATFFKVSNRSSETTIESIKKTKEQRMNILIIGIVLLTLAIFLLAIFGVLLYRYRVWNYNKISGQGNNALFEDITLRSLTYDELNTATNNFKDEIGKGAFGTVFRGVISNGIIVAIKRLENVVAEGDREFQNEMKVIGRTHHKNLVRLFGYCHDRINRLLVYEYMSNGSLADFLFTSEQKPAWEERVEIAQNIARGIFYLHEECETQIIHCDIKPENILIHEKGEVKIADFGLSKLLMPNQSKTYTGVRGTRGYVAPEWHRNLPITVKADVYSFGIMLLEIICCRRNVDMHVPDDEVVLADWVYECFEAN